MTSGWRQKACSNPGLYRAPHWNKPDRIIFDLDPPGKDFAPVREAAKLLQKLLQELGLKAYVMTIGSRGLRVVVPLAQKQTFDQACDFARDVASLLAQRHPKKLTVEPERQSATAGSSSTRRETRTGKQA